MQIAEQLAAPVELSLALQTLADILGSRQRFRERAQVAQRRATLVEDSLSNYLGERVDSLLSAGNSLSYVGEYAQAIPYLQHAERLADQINAIPPLVASLDRQGVCSYMLNRWDELLAIEPRRQALVQKWGLKRVGRMCGHTAHCAGVCALRGERELSAQFRDDSVSFMTDVFGPLESWPRLGRY